MLLWIFVMWTGLSVACALIVGKFVASVNGRWSNEEFHSCLKNPIGQMEIPFTMSSEPRQMAPQASAR
jgi:hypothetical protein